MSTEQDLIERLRVKAGMIHMGERIAWGSDSNLMFEAANVLETARQQAAVVLPPSPYMPDCDPAQMTDYEAGEAQGRCDMWAEVKRLNAAAPQAEQVVEMDRYDAGYLGDGGGGNVGWWQDYIRSELDRAHEFYQDQLDGITAPPTPDVSGLVEALEDIAGTHHHSASAGGYFAQVAREALAAHRSNSHE